MRISATASKTARFGGPFHWSLITVLNSRKRPVGGKRIAEHEIEHRNIAALLAALADHPHGRPREVTRAAIVDDRAGTADGKAVRTAENQF